MNASYSGMITSANPVGTYSYLAILSARSSKTIVRIGILLLFTYRSSLSLKSPILLSLFIAFHDSSLTALYNRIEPDTIHGYVLNVLELLLPKFDHTPVSNE